MIKQVQLVEVCELVAGQSPPSSSYNQDGKGVPFFQGKADFGELFPTVRYWCTEPKKMSIPEDILFSVRAPVGPTNINNIEACLGRGICAIRCTDRIVQKYLLHYLRANEHKIAALGTGSTFKAITIKELKAIKIPLPPLQVQKQISAILDAADELRQKDKALIAKYDELTQSLFLDMFGDPVTNPKGWETYKMSEVCSKVTDGTHDTPMRLTKGVKFITGKHIRPFVIDYSHSDYVTKEVHQEIYRRCNPQFGDVLYTNIGVNLGTAALNVVDYEFSMKNVALLKPHHDVILGRYLEHFLNSQNMKAKIVWMASIGGAQQFLSLTEIRRLNVMTPIINLQKEFSELVHNIEDQKAITIESLNKSETLFNSLLQKAFKGELTN